MEYPHINHIRVLGMYHRGHAQRPCTHHDIQDLHINQLHRRIRHVKLYTRNPLPLHHDGQFLLQDLLRRVRQDEMKSVVDVALSHTPSLIVLKHWE